MKFMNKNGGFTLVELIVVIAILAILAGVAVPAYSGYVEKANESADQTLLASVNTAFAAACAFNGESNYGRADSPSFDMGTGALTTANIKINESFGELYEGGTFKVMTALYYNGQLGAFKDMAGNGFFQIFGSIENIDELVALLNASAFGDIGAAGLMNKVDIVTGLAVDLAGENENFAASLGNTLPELMNTLGMSKSEFEAYMEGLRQQKAAELYPDDPTSADALNAATNAILANYAVLNAAKNTVGKTETEILADLKGGVTVDDIKSMMNKSKDATTQQEGMANAAMMYAMYTAYANGLKDDDPAKKDAMAIIESNDIGTFVTTMANQESAQYTGFQSYLDTQQAKDDVNGYLGAMNIINQSANGNPDAVGNLLVNGYGDADLAAALQGLMG